MRLRDEIQRSLGTPVRIRLGGLGELTVTADGRTVFSTRQAGRLPEPGEIVRLLGAAR